MGDPPERIYDDLRLQPSLSLVRNVTVDLTAAGRIAHHRPPITVRLDNVDHGGVNHVAALPIDPRAHTLSWNGTGHQHDAAVVAGEHGSARDRAFDTQV